MDILRVFSACKSAIIMLSRFYYENVVIHIVYIICGMKKNIKLETWVLQIPKRTEKNYFSILNVVGLSGGPNRADEPHPGVFWECQDSKKWQLFKICEKIF